MMIRQFKNEGSCAVRECAPLISAPKIEVLLNNNLLDNLATSA